MLIDVTNPSKIHLQVPSPVAATWDGSKWVIINEPGSWCVFAIDTTELVGVRPDFFYITLTTHTPIIDSYFCLIEDITNAYQWDTPIIYPYEQSVGVGQFTVGIDLFHSGLNNHLGDIAYIDVQIFDLCTSIDAMFFGDYIPPEVTPSYLWADNVNTREIIL